MLPQLKAQSILHKFVVFSIVNDDDTVKVKFAQCNNCGVIHKITDLCKSTILSGREEMSSISTKDDIAIGLSPELKSVLERADVDLPTWEQAKFIVDNKRWGEFVVLSKTNEDRMTQIKYLTILGEKLLNVETHIREY